VYLVDAGTFVYFGALLFWIVAFWSPKRKRAPLSIDMQNSLPVDWCEKTLVRLLTSNGVWPANP
jgi:hypothetical protein